MTAIGPEGDDRVELALDINMDDVDLEQALSKTIKDAITKAFGEVAEEGIVAEKFGTAEGLSNRGGSWLQDSLLGDSIDDNKDFASRVTPSAPIIEPPQDPLQEANKLSSEYRARSFNDQRGGNEELIPEDGTGFADLSEFWENLDDVDVNSLTADQQEELKGLKALRSRVDKESSSLATQAKSFVGDILPGRGGTNAIEKSIGGITENISTLSQLRGLGGGVGLASRAIPVAGAALAAYQGIQAGGEQIQELASIGNIQGEGAMGGLAFQANVQAMAMNPFINTEQARTIMMTALRDGYTGKEFDTLTDFMAPQPLSEPVLTPSGWRTMGDLREGDFVIGSDGKQQQVLGVFDKGTLDCFRVHFSDGSSVRCSDDHLWRVRPVAGKTNGTFRTVPLSQIRKKLFYTTKRGSKRLNKWRIPILSSPVEFSPEEKPRIDPYLLGLLLGDGDISCSVDEGRIRLYSFEDEKYSFEIPNGVEVSECSQGFTFGVGQHDGIQINRLGRPVNPMKLILEEYGLLGTDCSNKFIPREYLQARVEDRVSLLQGLVDTDGGVNRHTGKAYFTNTSEQLVIDFKELVESLGGRVGVNWRIPDTKKRFLESGQYITSKRPIAHVNIKLLPDWINPARLKRKAELYDPAISWKRELSIVDVTEENPEKMRCILVDSEDHLYVTKNYILTHNTNLREMNLTASQSMELFQRQVEQGGQSIEALGMQLEVLKRSAPDANISLEQQQQIYGQVSESVVGAGGSGQAGGEMGMLAAQMFNDNPTLKGRGGDYLTALNESPVFQGQLSQYRQQQNGGPYEDPQVAASNAMEERVFIQQAQEIHKQWLQQLIRNFPAFGEEGIEGDNARNRVIQSFKSYLHQQGLARVFPDDDHVGAYMDELLAGDIAGDAQKRVDESLGLEVEERRWYQKARSSLGNSWRDITGEDVLSDEELMNSADTLGDDYVQEEMQSRVQRRLQDSGYNLDALSAIIDNYDTRDVMIRDGDREVSLAEAEFDKELLDRLASGEATIKVGSGSEYQTLEDLSRSGEGQDKSDGSYIGGGKFTFEFTDEAKRLLKVTFEESDEVRDANSQSGKQPNTTDRHTRGKR